MATVDPQPPAELNMKEQLARIDRLLIETQNRRLEPDPALWQVAAIVLAGATACFLAGAATALHFR